MRRPWRLSRLIPSTTPLKPAQVQEQKTVDVARKIEENTSDTQEVDALLSVQAFQQTVFPVSEVRWRQDNSSGRFLFCPCPGTTSLWTPQV